MGKLVLKSSEIEDKILEAVDMVNDPIRQTLSPMGGDVLYDDAMGNSYSTNDGFTIIKNINSSDPVINQTIDVIKNSSAKTNVEAGDGTSSTVVQSSVLIKEGLRLLKGGWNQVKIRNEFNSVGNKLKDEISKFVNTKITEDDLLHIANVSSSNDKEIAENTVKVIGITGKEGQVIIQPGYGLETELVEDTGFLVTSGIFAQELAQGETFNARYEDVPVLITDKRLYYLAEAEDILSVALRNGYKSVVIVASDFIGEALPYFVENHKRGKIDVLLIKETRPEILNDLAIYLDGEVISDKSGALDNLQIENFTLAKKVFANAVKSIISRDKNEDNKRINKRVKEIEKEMKDIGNKSDTDYKNLEKRIASLTKGMVTIKVGGRTPIEVNEKIYRYEDAVNATRVALDGGYVVGGGITLYNAWKNVNKKDIDTEIVRVFDKYCQVLIRQIADNCGRSGDMILYEIDKQSDKNVGYNAVTDKISNLMKDGVIEPYKVATQTIENSISIANIIIKSRYRIVRELEEDKKN